MKYFLPLIALTLLALPAGAQEMLTIGSPAPTLDVEHWVTNRDGAFEPVTEFEAGKVYIVEFWATWCGPCIASMPHLASLQDKYADSGVQIISISDEDLATVEAFLEREVGNSKAAPKKPEVSEKEREEGTDEDIEQEPEATPTYADLCGEYCLTTDPDTSVKNDYMRAAFQNGIPTAFVVGKTGQIEWIGHPMRMDDPLEAVVSDSWDRATFAKTFKRQQQVSMVQAQVSRLLRQDQTDEALELIEATLGEVTPEAKAGLQDLRLQVLFMAKPDQAVEVLTAALEEADSPRLYKLTSMLAFTPIKNAEAKEKLILLAVERCKAAAEEEEDTQGKVILRHAASVAMAAVSRFDDAIELEQSALELAPEGMKRSIEASLKRLERQKKSAEQRAKKRAEAEALLNAEEAPMEPEA